MRRRGFLRFLLVPILLLSCASDDDIPFVRLNSEPARVSAERGEKRGPIRVAVAPIISPEATARMYGPFMEYLQARLKRPAAMVQRRTYGEVNELVRSAAVHLAFVCSGAYVVGHRRFGMELLAAPVVDGRQTYRSYIIVDSELAAGNFRELRGKRFAFTDILSNSGYFYPSYLLRVMDERAVDFFSEVVFTHSHDRSVRSVAEGLVDAAAVDSLVYERLRAEEDGIGARTRVIAQSPPFGMPPVVVNPALPRGLKRRLRGVLLQMQRDPAATAALSGLGIGGFAEISDSAYDGVREIVGATGAGAR